MTGSNSQEQVKHFLRAYPDGHLYVTVGFASVWGLSWLNEYTRGRQVTLVIGNTQKSRFKNAMDSDRGGALEFLSRQDVQVLNWYRTNKSSQGASTMHAKGWIVADRKGTSAEAAMIGSANLSREGLQANWEMVALVASDELPRLWSQLDVFLKGRGGNRRPWNVERRLAQTIESEINRVSSAPIYSPPVVEEGVQDVESEIEDAQRAEPGPPQLKGGCFSWAASIAVVAVTILITTLFFLF